MVFIFFGCKNPFAPREDFSGSGNTSPISDQSTIDGVFQNLQYSYTFKDTTIYSGILTDDFIFTYRDYDLGYDVSWGRDEEMRITYNLFQNTERLDIIWNNIIISTGDSTQADVIRAFNLTVTFNPSDVITVYGQVDMSLRKDMGKWRIVKWIDESNF